MFIGETIRQFREAKKLSQGDVEDRTGLRRCYVSRVENGHTVPSLETLEKIARALEAPLYQLFYSEGGAPKSNLHSKTPKDDWASRGKGHRVLRKFQIAISKMSDGDRDLLLQMAGTVKRAKERSNP
jgi:transcriptional regulator with XRE-family HTH domain